MTEFVAIVARSYRVVEPPRCVTLGGREATRMGVVVPEADGLVVHSVLFITVPERSAAFLLGASAVERGDLHPAEAVLQTVRFEP
jgi:hypothetical protein